MQCASSTGTNLLLLTGHHLFYKGYMLNSKLAQACAPLDGGAADVSISWPMLMRQYTCLERQSVEQIIGMHSLHKVPLLKHEVSVMSHT